MGDATAVRAVNALTAGWAGQALRPGRETVLSAAGVWPLLALLAAGSGGPARDDLERATGIGAGEAAEAAGRLLARMDGLPGVAAAVGLWSKATLPLEPGWVGMLPPASHGMLSGDVAADRAAMDAWADKRTGGLVPGLPIPFDEETELVLAGALTVRTDWLRPFTEVSGVLYRETALLDRTEVVAAPCGPVTVLKVLGTGGIDVHLLRGEAGTGGGEVLAAGIGALRRAHPAVPGDRLPYGEPGPGVTVSRVCSWDRQPSLDVTVVPFEVTAHHDLLDHAELFGLALAVDTSRGHFPGISRNPLAVGAAGQTVAASFSALGYRSAAVTAFGFAAGGVPPATAKRVAVEFAGPIGFLAVHRTSRLVLNAGWVCTPSVDEMWAGHDEEDEDWDDQG
ncbi:serpin family protein [Streptomyces sp. MI02-7b]|uniref:serpin family protein n=1 Tax=Streptomyces sp. MI02-7b TaxID=462941 RepID=UPI0029ACD1EC|nr:serpin family protein [Streptomyces sp. MI02-7b]MDX3075487.1 serpin family protein [Streptomyces sp. MI02-7b]